MDSIFFVDGNAEVIMEKHSLGGAFNNRKRNRRILDTFKEEFDKSNENGTVPLDEETSRKYFRDMIRGVEYLHYQRIIHRDIKPENLLKTADGNLKLGDFGVSHIFWSTDTLKRTVGTTAFLSPEMCQGGEFHGRDCDVWAMGCSLYCFIFGKVPFLGPNTLQTYNQIVSKELEFTRVVNPSLENLFRRILDKNPRTRITINELKKHPWVTKDGKEPLSTTLERIIVSETDIVESITHLRKLTDISITLARKMEKIHVKIHSNSVSSKTCPVPTNDESKSTL